MITKQQASKLKQLIARHKRAAIDRSWSGAMHPDDREAIENSYNKTAKALRDYIAGLTGDADESQPGAPA